MLKKIGLVLLAVTFALLVFPSFLSRTAQWERRITIKSSPATVYAVLKDLHQFRSWNPWSVVQPESAFKVEGQGLGSVYSWEGEDVGRGNMVIKDLKDNERVDVLLTYEKPFAFVAQIGWTLAGLENGDTEVVWYFKQELSYFQRYFGLIVDGMFGSDFEFGLARLKAKLEATGA